VRVVFVIVLDPASDQLDDGFGIGQRVDLDVIALERVHEGLGHSVGLRASDGCEARIQPQLSGEGPGFAGRVGAAVVGEHLDRLRRPAGAEAPLHRHQHHVAHVRPADPGTGYRRPGDDFAVAGIDDEGQADDLAVPAGKLQPVGTPAQVRADHHHLAVMAALGLKWSWFSGQVCGFAKVYQIYVHAAFRVSVWLKYAVSGVRLSRAVWGRSEL